MNRAEIFLEDANKLNLADIIKKIPKNNLNWYILELSASGNLKNTSFNRNMSEFLHQIHSEIKGIKLSYSQLIELANVVENTDEYFIIGCKMENVKPIGEIIQEKNNYEYIIDYFDSTSLNVYSTNLKFISDIISLYFTKNKHENKKNL